MNNELNKNYCEFVGHITKNPLQKLKHLDNGNAVMTLTIAIKTPAINKSGEIYDRTAFANIVVWDDLARRMAKSLKAGDKVEVKAQLQTRNYKDKDGKTQWVTEFVAIDVTPKQQAAA